MSENISIGRNCKETSMYMTLPELSRLLGYDYEQRIRRKRGLLEWVQVWPCGCKRVERTFGCKREEKLLPCEEHTDKRFVRSENHAA